MSSLFPIYAFFIPGYVVAWFTFPGVIVHELAHQLFCRLARIAVLDVCYFKFTNPPGYVIHEIPPRPSQQMLITIGPFFVNSILGALIALPAMLPVWEFDSGGPLEYALIWLGVSIAMHAFPSTGDAQQLWKAAKDAPLGMRLAAAPIVALIYVGAVGSVVWLDLIYGVALAVAAPRALVRLLA